MRPSTSDLVLYLLLAMLVGALATTLTVGLCGVPGQPIAASPPLVGAVSGAIIWGMYSRKRSWI